MKLPFLKNQEKISSFGVVFIRLAFGYHLLYYSWESVMSFDVSSDADFLLSLGIPFPTMMAWAYLLTEFIGGCALIVGFKVRLISIPLIVTFLVAYFLVHKGDPYLDSFQALQMLAVSFFFLFNDSGKYSIDGFLKK